MCGYMCCAMDGSLCESLTHEMACTSCEAVKCPVCSLWLVKTDADAHIDECYEIQDTLSQMKMEADARKDKASKAAAAKSAGKSKLSICRRHSGRN